LLLKNLNNNIKKRQQQQKQQQQQVERKRKKKNELSCNVYHTVSGSINTSKYAIRLISDEDYHREAATISSTIHRVPVRKT